MNNNGYLLLVEDEILVQENNKMILERRGYTIRQAYTLAEARAIVSAEPPGAIVLDIQLPDGNGLDFLQELRKTSNVPVLMLTAMGTSEDIVRGLEAGGDDYLPKPYNFSVFISRVAALLRRASLLPEKSAMSTENKPQKPGLKSKQACKVLIVDDHESICDSLTHELEGTGDFSVVGKVKRADHADLFCERLKPDLVFMDVCTEDGASGLDATKEIRQKFQDIKIIVMSGFDEISYAPRAKEAGAHAFVFKSKSLGFFAKVASDIMQGKTYWPEAKTIPMPMGEAPLTEREMEVLRLMCKHMTSKEIADELFISENTVKYHKSNMLAKTGFTKAVDLSFYMITNGWINPKY